MSTDFDDVPNRRSLSDPAGVMTPPVATAGLTKCVSGRRKIFKANEQKMRKIILRQRNTICRLNKRLANVKKLDSSKPVFSGIVGKQLGSVHFCLSSNIIQM